MAISSWMSGAVASPEPAAPSDRPLVAAACRASEICAHLRVGPSANRVIRDGVGSAVLRVLFVAYVLATAVHIGLVVAHEPFAFDAWNLARDTRAEPFSLGGFLDYGTGQYLNSNPRIGQWLAYLAYKLEYFAVVTTPLAYLALAFAVAILGMGRWPSWRRGRDLALCAVALGSLWFALPRLGMLLFCRAYCTNYVYGAAIQLWFLVPLRLHVFPLETATPAVTLPYFLFGIAAGMCNEHTGPTLALFALTYAVWRQRSTGRRPNLAWAGALGVVVGFAAVFFAPGQGERYEGLAERVGFVQRLIQRGITGNLDIFRDYLISAGPVLGLVAIALVVSRGDPEAEPRRRALGLVGGALLAGALITATVFVSPKLGWRFYLHSCALLLAAFIAVADAALVTARRLAPFVLLAVAASVYAGFKTIPLYLRLDEASDARLAALEAAPPGAVFTAESFGQVEDTWWFLGDDFRDIRKRQLITDYFALGGVLFRGVDIEAPLGLSDVRFRPRYKVSPPGCLDEHGGLELGSFRGIDVKATHDAIGTAIIALRQRLAARRGTLEELELEVGFVGAPPAGLPERRLIVGRWRPDRYEGWAARIERGGIGKTRTVKLPKELAGTDAEILLYQVGGETRRLGTARDRLDYVPWKQPAAYWALACPPQDQVCFVIAATRLL
jgi:hypothetical protein